MSDPHHVTEEIGDLYSSPSDINTSAVNTFTSNRYSFLPSPTDEELASAVYDGAGGGMTPRSKKRQTTLSVPNIRTSNTSVNARTPPSSPPSADATNPRSPPRSRNTATTSPTSPTSPRSPNPYVDPRSPTSPPRATTNPRNPIIAINNPRSPPRKRSPPTQGSGGSASAGTAGTSASGGTTTAPTSPTSPASHHYPLNTIDYETSPHAVAMEISNLQALRRMSMDVTSADPDLPNFSPSNSPPPGSPSIPGINTPSDSSDEATAVFWVPARLHPELAPQEFSAYLEKKKAEISRRSSSASLSPDQGPALRRKKSMLSQRVDSPAAYRDGAERLEKRRSVREPPGIKVEDLMKDPVALMAKLTEAAGAGGGGVSGGLGGPVIGHGGINTGDLGESGGIAGIRTSTGSPAADFDDTPIIFAPKVGLKRSTATHYRRGSLRRGERIGSKRSSRPEDEDPMPPGFRLQRSNTEPLPPGLSDEQAEEKDQVRPLRGSLPASSKVMEAVEKVEERERCKSVPGAVKEKEGGRKRGGSEPKPMTQDHGIVVGKLRSSEPPTILLPPKIVETPPIELPERKASLPSSGISTAKGRKSEEFEKEKEKKEEKEKEKDAKKLKPTSTSGSVKDRKTSWGWLLGSDSKNNKTEDTTTTTSSKSLQPTSSSASESQSPSSSTSGKKKRPKSSEKLTKDRDRDKVDKIDRDKLAERERFDKEKISKEKQEKDKARLDLLQKSIETSSSASPSAANLLPSSSSFSSSSSSSSTSSTEETPKIKDKDKDKEKEKDPPASSTTNSFLSFFGGSRKKSSEHNSQNQSSSSNSSKRPKTPQEQNQQHQYQQQQQQQQQQPPFYYTRFPIHIERAIYRLSHLKLANPRRPLQQQVLLSNFMYSYLAKVQQTQPQLIAQAGTRSYSSSSSSSNHNHNQGNQGNSNHNSNNNHNQGNANNRSSSSGGITGDMASAGYTAGYTAGNERDRERDQRWIQRQEEYAGRDYDDVS
ncbi:hypothetical protein BZA77DRAFT_108620 [Pyronema omphalodes]|nr:hypothetical protein BZA77DRAFT_108620 [Pyronema omphalodes]